MNEDTDKIILSITGYGNPSLRAGVEKVAEATPEISNLVYLMTETILHLGGHGISAPMVGSPLSIIVMNVKGCPAAMINPVLINASDEKETDVEGSYSLPGIRVPVERPKTRPLRSRGLQAQY